MEHGEIGIGGGFGFPFGFAVDGAFQAQAGSGVFPEEAVVTGEVVVHERTGAGDEFFAAQEDFAGFFDALLLAQGEGPGDPRALELGAGRDDAGGEGDNARPSGGRHRQLDMRTDDLGLPAISGGNKRELGAGFGTEIETQITEGVVEVFAGGDHADAAANQSRSAECSHLKIVTY
jgi:hypothetical protein